MANPDHIEIFKQGPKAWNEWREKNPNIKPDLSGLGDYDLNFRKLKLQGKQLWQFDLSGANLSCSLLHGVDLGGALLSEACFSETDLRGSNLIDAYMGHADLSYANLNHVDLRRANLNHANLREADLSYAGLIDADLTHSNLIKAVFRKVVFENTRFSSKNQLRDLSYDLTPEQISGCVFTDEIKKQKSPKKSENSSISLASLERTLSSQISTLRDQMEERLKNQEELSLDQNHIDQMIAKKLDKELSGDIVKLIGEEATKQSVEYAEREAEHAKRERVTREFEDQFNNSFSRLNQHAVKAERASRFFLICGLLLALIGLAMTYHNIWVFEQIFYNADARAMIAPDMSLSWFDTIFHVPVTIPFIILCEVFALIMFRYYSKAMERMRSYTNEVTTLSIIASGVNAIAEYGDKDDMIRASHKLMCTERNRILGKGESTAENISAQDETQMIANLTAVLSKITKKP